MELFEMGSTHNNKNSFYFLAVIYKNGDGVKKDIHKAIKYYEKACELGDSDALNNLGAIYYNGDESEGIKTDLQKAVHYYEKAISMGQKDSIYNLALIYEMGDEENGKIEKDINRACSLYYKAFMSFGQDEIYKKKFLKQFEIHQNEIVWRKEYHIYWKKDEHLNTKIFLILLISKKRRETKNKVLDAVLVKGITINIIKYLCHIS